MAKLDAASLQAEEGSVATFVAGSSALNRKLVGISSGHSLSQSRNLSLNVVTRCLQELSANWPSSLTVIAHEPRLGEDVTSNDLVLVWEAFLDKASRVANFFLSLRA